MPSGTELDSNYALVFSGVSLSLPLTAALLTGSAFRRPYFTGQSGRSLVGPSVARVASTGSSAKRAFAL